MTVARLAAALDDPGLGPVVVIGPGGCEPARLVTQHGFGCGSAAEQIDDNAAYILKVAGDPNLRDTLGASALAFDQLLGGSAAAVKHWERLLQGETRPKPACRPAGRSGDLGLSGLNTFAER